MTDFTKDPIWQKLASMQIEPDGARLTFVARLARENGWSLRFARAVMEEYRRFLYLAATGDRVTTPSDAVDQAWHLHLAYTRHYWGELCENILGKPLHHGPTAGGDAQDTHFRNVYEETLSRYRAVFGGEPPMAIWPDSDTRFGGRFRRVDMASHWMIPRAFGKLALAGGGAMMLAACVQIGGFPFDLTTTIAIVVVAFLIIRGIIRGGKPSRGRGDSGCSSTSPFQWNDRPSDRIDNDGRCGSDRDNGWGNDSNSNDSGSSGCSSSGCGGGGCGGGGD